MAGDGHLCCGGYFRSLALNVTHGRAAIVKVV
jgi:hypothetical protein